MTRSRDLPRPILEVWNAGEPTVQGGIRVREDGLVLPVVLKDAALLASAATGVPGWGRVEVGVLDGRALRLPRSTEATDDGRLHAARTFAAAVFCAGWAGEELDGGGSGADRRWRRQVLAECFRLAGTEEKRAAFSSLRALSVESAGRAIVAAASERVLNPLAERTRATLEFWTRAPMGQTLVVGVDGDGDRKQVVVPAAATSADIARALSSAGILAEVTESGNGVVISAPRTGASGSLTLGNLPAGARSYRP